MIKKIKIPSFGTPKLAELLKMEIPVPYAQEYKLPDLPPDNTPEIAKEMIEQANKMEKSATPSNECRAPYDETLLGYQ